MFKYTMLFLLLMGLFAFLMTSAFLTNDFYSCYSATIEVLEVSERDGVSSGWERRRICVTRKEAFEELDVCLEEKAGKWLPIMPAVEKVMSWVEPNLDKIKSEQAKHDELCAPYSELLLE